MKCKKEYEYCNWFVSKGLFWKNMNQKLKKEKEEAIENKLA